MEDTDWRPSPCPLCGEMREAARTPVCRNVACDCYVGTSRSMKSKHRYIWDKQGRPLALIDDIELLYKDPEFDPDEDKIYELGPEVKLEVSVKVILAQPVFRGAGMDIITTNRNK